MSAGNDIFGNLDDFLENYDDNYLETSKLSELENDVCNPAPKLDKPNTRNKKSRTVETRNQSSAATHKNITDPKLPNSIIPPVSGPPPESTSNAEGVENVMLRKSNAARRSTAAARRSTAAALRSTATALRSTPAARRRSRRLANTIPAPPVIILDDDDSYSMSSQANVGVPSNIITIDSDDERPSLHSISHSANNSFEFENYEMRIKIKWGNGIVTFTHRKHQKFGDLIAKLAAKEAADTRCILLNLDDRIIYANDTPDSIGYKTFQFISGRVLKDKAPVVPTSTIAGKNNMILLKVQLANRKAPLQLEMDKNQTMIVLVIKCAEELKCNPEDIKLYFDGDLVDNGSKPGDLELEGDELLDIRFVR